jgi:hypothetical protein
VHGMPTAIRWAGRWGRWPQGAGRNHTKGYPRRGPNVRLAHAPATA